MNELTAGWLQEWVDAEHARLAEAAERWERMCEWANSLPPDQTVTIKIVSGE